LFIASYREKSWKPAAVAGERQQKKVKEQQKIWKVKARVRDDLRLIWKEPKRVEDSRDKSLD
jgi:hypothetical protein